MTESQPTQASEPQPLSAGESVYKPAPEIPTEGPSLRAPETP
jgi:hypothetical protein